MEKGTRDWIEYLIHHNQPDYATKYTKDIMLPNAFSASVLAFSIDKQIELKLGKGEPIKYEARVFVGDVIHQFLQSKLPPHYICNQELRYHIPFQWKTINCSDIIIICHPDAFSLRDRKIIEFKTSFGTNSNGKITEAHKRQVCFYWKIILGEYKINCDARVIKLWAETVKDEESELESLRTREWVATEEEKEIYSNDMIMRAIQCAKELDQPP